MPQIPKAYQASLPSIAHIHPGQAEPYTKESCRPPLNLYNCVQAEWELNRGPYKCLDPITHQTNCYEAAQGRNHCRLTEPSP